MVMASRPDVATAGPIGSGRAMAGLATSVGRAWVGASLRAPEWVRGPAPNPAANAYREYLRSTVKAVITYAASLPTPELRSTERAIDTVAGAVLPPPWRRHDVTVRDASVGGVPALVVEPAADRGATILYLHGGGYLATTPRMYLGLAARLAVDTGCRIVLPDYRLAPEFAYPAALDDVGAAYRSLLDEGDPATLLVAGDSGGGGLAAALLAELPALALPRPAGTVLISPEVDLALSGASVRENAAEDILPDDVPTAAYLAGHDDHDPLVSPLYADLGGYPPLLVTAGGDEMFVDEIRRFVERARAASVHVTYYEAEGRFHVFEILRPFTDATSVAFDDITRFAAACLDAR